MIAEQAITMAHQLFGVAVSAVQELGSHQDRNFALTIAAGPDEATTENLLVLKVANSGQSLTALQAQDAALRHLIGLPLTVPQPLAGRDGSAIAVADLAGVAHAVRLLTFVPGIPMTSFEYLNPHAAHAIGAAAGAVTAALAGFDHPGAHESSQWDLANFAEVVIALSPTLGEASAANRVASVAGAACAALSELPPLPRQVIHGDLTDFNLVARRAADGSPRPAGVIDFGDLAYSWRVGELAITICSLLAREPTDPLRLARAVARGFLDSCPLTAAELAALWPLVTARACAGLVGTAAQLRHEPENTYLHENLTVDQAVFDIAAGVPMRLGQVVMLQLGQALPAHDPAVSELLGKLVPDQASAPEPGLQVLDVPAQAYQLVDLSPASPLLDDGAWLEPRSLRRRLSAHLAGGPGLISHGQGQPHAGGPPGPAAPATITLGVTALVPTGTPVRAPWPGLLHPEGPGTARLQAPGRLDLILAGVHHIRSTEVHSGAVIGTVAPSTDPALPDHLHLQLAAPGVAVPRHCPAHLAPAWELLCPDPSSLLGVVPPATPASFDLLGRRAASLAGVQKTYFADPPEMVRGWRHILVDAFGRAYLDGVNNVAVLGHSHPGVARAVDRSLRTLNTNSRFNLSAPIDFAEALLATLPTELDRVFLVSSGSEAVDLALRLARVHTGARDVIALRGAYHGWTTATDEVSSALMDNPNALETRPRWVHLAEPPNQYRGPFTGPDAGPRYAADVDRIIAELQASGQLLAGFVCEPALNGNAGGIELPGDYLPAVYQRVRAAGGVVIADEVQVGYGRLGCHFWGFQCAGVVPDVVCLAKATGNGFPVAAVVTRAEIAESFASQGSFFASMGGTPAGAAAGLATLAAITDEDLMGNAARMGRRLRSGLEALVARFPMAGAVHGRGLYLGLELVADRATREPATAATDALCERLLTLGVIMAATGDDMNVLKIKPPLSIDAAGVDHLLAALRAAFEHGW